MHARWIESVRMAVSIDRSLSGSWRLDFVPRCRKRWISDIHVDRTVEIVQQCRDVQNRGVVYRERVVVRIR